MPGSPMNDQTLTELTGEEEKTAAARSRIYELFARLFDYPDKAFGEAIRTGELAERIRQTLSALDPSVLEEASELRWVLWDPGDAVGGWALHLAVEDPQDGMAWAISAVDMI